MCEQYTAQPLRLCNGCGSSFPATTEWFYFNKGYLGRKCKTCRSAQIEAARLIRAQPVTGMVIAIACQTCGRDFDWIRKASRQPIHCSRACKDRSGYIRRREKIIAYQVAYRAGHRKYINDRQTVYRSQHAEQINERLRRYYEGHRQRWYEYNKAWRRRNPERAAALAKAAYNLRRARMAGAAWIEPVDHEAILVRDRWICGLCGKKVESRNDLHFDHITPLSKGGAHAEWNIQVTHARCNMLKHNRLIGQPRLPL